MSYNTVLRPELEKAHPEYSDAEDDASTDTMIRLKGAGPGSELEPGLLLAGEDRALADSKANADSVLLASAPHSHLVAIEQVFPFLPRTQFECFGPAPALLEE